MTPKTTPKTPAKRTRAKTASKKTASKFPALNLSEYLPKSSGNAELDEYKKLVRKVAQEHSTTHHCGSLGEVEEKLGIRVTVPTAAVELTTTFGCTFRLNVEPQELAYKTGDEQLKVLLDKIGSVSLMGSKGVTGSLQLTPDNVSSFTLVDLERGWDTSQGIWRYPNSGHNVAHFAKIIEVNPGQAYSFRRVDNGMATGQVISECGAYYIGKAASATSTSSGVKYFCTRCRTAAAAVNVAPPPELIGD